MLPVIEEPCQTVWLRLILMLMKKTSFDLGKNLSLYAMSLEFQTEYALKEAVRWHTGSPFFYLCIFCCFFRGHLDGIDLVCYIPIDTFLIFSIVPFLVSKQQEQSY